MKRIIPLLLMLLALCGCSTEPELPGETAGETLPDEPTGFYDPESELESSTQGAVQVYPLNRSDCYGLLPMGEDLLLFAGAESTTLIKVSGSNLYITATADLDCTILPESCSVQVSEKGVTFYDERCRELVFLDPSLNEVSRIALPEDIQGEPALSADRKSLYYCTADALRVFDMETGFHKLLKEMSFEDQRVSRLHCADTVIECTTGPGRTLFISAGTGMTLWESSEGLELTTNGQAYFAVRADGIYRELLVGTADIGPYALYFDDIHAAAIPLLETGAAVLASSQTDLTTVTLHYFDLESGMRTASLELDGPSIPRSIHADPNSGAVWLLRYDDTYDCDTVYRWNPQQSPTGDDAIYISDRITSENPDAEGLVRCQEKAAEVSIKHGVDVRVWTDAVSEAPEGYTLTAEYQVPVILECLEILDQALASYPAGFLKETASGTSDGTLRLCLVRAIEGSPTAGSPETTAGIQFWDDQDNACICLCASPALEQNLYHELFHIIESRVLSTCSAYDDWDDLNPDGFEYDYSYLDNLNREVSGLTEGESKAFIDTYSMSFPREDRARIMEYAMMPGNEEYFTSAVLQAKLRILCQGIREAYALEDSPETYLWEQHLEEPPAAEEP